MTASGSFKVVRRDPLMIIWQILTLQCMFYWTLATLQALVDLILNLPVEVSQVLDFQAVNVRNQESFGRLLVCIATSVASAYWIRFVVCKAKMCLDFAFTMYFIHFLVCWARSGSIQLGLSWWLLQVLCITVTTVLGEYLCMQVELQDIPVSLVPMTQV